MNRHLEYKREYDTLANIPPKSLRSYVESRGWRKAATRAYPGTARVYELNANGDGITVMESARFADYPLRMWEAIRTLADAENREWSAVLSDLLLSDLDAVRVRRLGDSRDGAIPLDAGATLIRCARDMLLSAACSAQRSQPAFRLGVNKKARRYIERARLGQTGRGSFIINIWLPTSEERDAFPDKVIHKLVSGLSAVHAAARFSDSGADFRRFADEIPNGVSANLCGALAETLGDRAAEGVEISITWALSRSPALEPFQIRFDKSHAAILQGASKYLKGVEWRRAASAGPRRYA